MTMNRCIALLLALLCASLTVSSACVAASGDWIEFDLRPTNSSNQIYASFSDERGRNDNHWSTDFAPSELAGLDLAGFRARGAHEIRFAVIREAGRLDCLGTGGNSRASGNCRFTADAGFTAMLERIGTGRPTARESFALMAVNARRETLDALAAARYPAPSINDLTALAALGVDGNYIRGLASVGYRPSSLDALVQFKALNITPEYVGGFIRIGYSRLAADDLVQLKALNVTPAYVSGFQQIGYRDLSPDTLVQLKALDITPEFVRSVQRQEGGTPPVDTLVNRKIFARRN
jgi:hypothetical protein